MDENVKNKNSRWGYIDALKGIGILLVLLGHASFSEVLTNVIYLFHMPLFFVLSGYTDKANKSIGRVVKDRSRSILYPYVVFGIIILIYNTTFDCLRGIATLQKLIKRFVALLYGNLIWENNSDYIGTLWFLVALFWSCILFTLIYKLYKRDRLLSFLMIIGMLIAGVIFQYLKDRIGLRLPWCIDVAFTGGILYLIGFVAKSYSDSSIINSRWVGLKAVILVVMGFIVGYINLDYIKQQGGAIQRTDMLNLNYGILPIFIISSACVSVGFVTLAKYFYQFISFSLMERIGKMSLILMIVHIYVNQIVMMGLQHFNLGIWVIYFPISTIISLLVSHLIHRYCRFLYIPATNKSIKFKNE